jgi:cell division protein FtsQ
MREAVAGRRRAIAIVVAAVVVLGAAAWASTYTSLFSAKHIRVRGVRVLSADDVRAIGQISSATNVAHLDAGAVRARLLGNPWVADADVSTDLPNTVVVTIRERRPVGVIEAMGERSILASDGSAMPAAGISNARLPVVRAGLGSPTPEQRTAAADLLGALDPVVFGRVTGVLVGQDGDVAMTLRPALRVEAGQPGGEIDKAQTLRAILRWAAQQHLDLTSIDISTPDAPSVQLSDGSTVTP